MDEGARRLLYLDGYTVQIRGRVRRPATPSGTASPPPRSSGTGWGPWDSTSAGQESPRPPRARRPRGRLSWILSNYRSVLNALVEDPPDVIFSFHIFSTFPAEIRRMALDLGLSVPIVGYTHGSHWDPTDTFRFQVYPGMELLDLANLHVLDRILLASEYMRATLWENIGAFNSSLARQLDAKAVVVGLPLDVKRIDACRTDLPLP